MGALKTEPTFSIYLDGRSPLKEKVNGEKVYPLKFRATFQVARNGKKDWVRKLISLNHYCSDDDYAAAVVGKRMDTTQEKISILITESKQKANNIVKTSTTLTPDEFEKKFLESTAGNLECVVTMYDIIIKELEAAEQIGSADAYRASVNSLMFFSHPAMYEKMKYTLKDGKIVKGEIDYPLSFMEITPAWLQRYFATFENKTTPSIYLRQLRAVFNRAIDDDIIREDLYPFSRSKGKRNSKKKFVIKKTKGRSGFMALDVEDKNRLLNLKDPKLKWAVDMWRLSYYCSGINMIDIALLTNKKIGKDVIITDRHKIKNTDPDNVVVIPLNDEIREIIHLHGRQKDGTKSIAPNDYVFPFLKPGLTARQIKTKVANVVKLINDGLLEVEKQLELPVHLTTYTARHTFANIILAKGGTKEFLKDALVHSLQSTTDEYCAPYDLKLKREMQSLL